MYVYRRYKDRYADRKCCRNVYRGALWGFRDREELENNGADIVAAVPGDLFTIYEEKQHD